VSSTPGVTGMPLQPAVGQPHQPTTVSSSEQQKHQVESHCSRTFLSSDLSFNIYMIQHFHL
jgi:hypothetical protein